MPDLSEQLATLAELRDAGYLTPAEYEAQRSALLATVLGPPGPSAAGPAPVTVVPTPVVAAGATPPASHPRNAATGARTSWLRVAAFVLAGIALAAYWSLPSSPSDEGGDTACEAAFHDAADGSVEADVEYDLDPALRVCGSLAAWSAAWRRYPPQAGTDPRFVAENRCRSGQFNDTAICRELGIAP